MREIKVDHCCDRNGVKDVDFLLIATLDAIIHLGIHHGCAMSKPVIGSSL